MKVVFYGVQMVPGSGWEWRITLDLPTDLEFMKSEIRRGGRRVERILRLEPELSFGQARRWQAIFNVMNRGEMTGDRVKNRIAGNAELLEALPEGVRRRLVWREVGAPMSSGGAAGEAGDAGSLAVDPVVLERLVRLLDGRSLLVEELQALLADQGLSEAAERWKVYVQAAVLMGKLRCENGVEARVVGGLEAGSVAGSGIASEVKWWGKWFRKSVQAQCRRCGSNRLNYTHCSSCGGLCAYCEDCLTMGRVRFCSLMLRSSSNDAGGRPGSGGVDVAPVSVPTAEELRRRWGLSPAQAAASHEGLVFLSAPVGSGGDRATQVQVVQGSLGNREDC